MLAKHPAIFDGWGSLCSPLPLPRVAAKKSELRVDVLFLGVKCAKKFWGAQEPLRQARNKGHTCEQGTGGCYWYCARGGVTLILRRISGFMPLLFQTQGLRSLCQFSFLKRILPLDSILFRSWRFLLWSCLVDGKMAAISELQLIQLGQLRNIKLAAQLDKEGRFNGSVWSSVSRKKVNIQQPLTLWFSVGGCAAVPHIWNHLPKDRHRIHDMWSIVVKTYVFWLFWGRTFAVHLTFWIYPSPPGFWDPNPLRLTLPSTSWKHEALEDWWSAMRVCRCHSRLWRYLIPWDIGNVGFPNFVVISWDIGIWKRKNMMWYGSFNESSSRC